VDAGDKPGHDGYLGFLRVSVVNFPVETMRRAIEVHSRGHWPADAALDTVTLTYLDRHRRRIRLVADSGQNFLLDLRQARHLVEGDGLELEGGGYLRVRAAAEPIFEIAAADPADMLRIAWHLGNRHLPLQVAGARLRISADHVIGEMVTGLGGHITRLEAAFDPEIGAYSGAAHTHHRDDDDENA
jgi:urease accessory protein